MIDESIRNKMMEAAPSKKLFTFPGDGIWHPDRIEAATVAEAEVIYHQIKRLIAPDATVNPIVPTIGAAGPAPLSTPAPAPKEEDVQ